MQNYCSFIKRKTNFISLQVDFLIQLVYVPLKTLWSCGEFSNKKAIGGCKSQIFVLGYRIAGSRDRSSYPGRRSVRLGDDFDLVRG